MKIYESRIDQVKSVIRLSNDFSGIVSRLDSIPVNKKFLNEYSSLVLDSLETSESLGRSLVVEKDRKLSEVDTVAAKNYIDYNWFVCDDNNVKISFDLLPKKAIEYLNYKAITIAGVEHDQILFDVKKKVLQAIKEGLKFEEWKLGIDELFDSYGITKLHPHHAETVFRTNLYSAYSIGQLEQAQSMSDRFPAWQYSAIHDFATRPEHAQYDGLIFNIGEGPIPPIDFNCRCSAIYLHVTQSVGLTIQKWKSDKSAIKFDQRKSFDKWLKNKNEIITKPVHQWMDDKIKSDVQSE